MKNTFLSTLLLLGAAATLFNCSKDEALESTTTGQATICATVEEPTRTSLNMPNVLWSKGDAIMMVDHNSGRLAKYTLAAGAGKTSAIFTGDDLEPGERKTYAIYPYDSKIKYLADYRVFDMELPSTQTYISGETFQTGANPMAATYTPSRGLTFNNMCGVIHLQLTGDQKVGRILVTTTSANKNNIFMDEIGRLAGQARVEPIYLGVNLQMYKESAKRFINLQCNEGVQLNTVTPTSFYIVVPPNTYNAGLQFLVYDEKGVEINSLLTAKELTVDRSQVVKLPARTLVRANFPDATFRKYLQEKHSFVLTNDGQDIDIEANKDKFAKVDQIWINANVVPKPDLHLLPVSIASMKGVEYFPALESIVCVGGQLERLDLDKNIALKQLRCYENRLTSLDIRKCINLETVYCGDQLGNGGPGTGDGATPKTNLDLTLTSAQVKAGVVKEDTAEAKITFVVKE